MLITVPQAACFVFIKHFAVQDEWFVVIGFYVCHPVLRMKENEAVYMVLCCWYGTTIIYTITRHSINGFT